MNSRKRVLMNLVENGLVHQVRGEGEGGMKGGSSADIHTLPCVNRYSQWEDAI